MSSPLTKAGWIKLRDLSYVNPNGEKVRVYERPQEHLDVALEAIKEANANKGRSLNGFEVSQEAIKRRPYLKREGSSFSLLDQRPFFSRVLYPSAPSCDLLLPQVFKHWFQDLDQLAGFIKNSRLPKDLELKFFFYLAHRYQYNAPFNLNENTRLNYQTSPLALADRNSYLRSSRTPWMQLASQLVFQQLEVGEKDLSIIWIAHPNFTSFLGEFYTVEKISYEKVSEPHQIGSLFDKWTAFNEESSCLYIVLKDLPGNVQKRWKAAKKRTDEMLEVFSEKLKEFENKKALRVYFRNEGLPARLFEAGLVILDKGGLGKSTSDYENEEVVQFLKKRYGHKLAEKHSAFSRRINDSFIIQNWDEDVVKELFGLYKKNQSAFLSIPNLKNHQDLLNFLKTNYHATAFKDDLDPVLLALKTFPFKDYMDAFRDELKKISRPTKKASDIVCIFYEECFEGLDCLVSSQGGKGMQNIASVTGNLGYSPDASYFLRTLIKGYPSFFSKGSNSFLEAAMTTKALGFKEDPQKLALQAQAHLSSIESGGMPSFENLLKRFSNMLGSLENLISNPSKKWVRLYSGFLFQLLTPLKDEVNKRKYTDFPLLRIVDHVQDALKFQDDISLFIRCVQDAIEDWMLYLDLNPQKLDPHGVFRSALPYPPSVVHFTPYAMRSFTRVLQTAIPHHLKTSPHPLKMQVFSQSYFELITNMERFRNKATVYLSQSDIQMQDCDLYFIDIHPNNAVETRLFAHDMQKVMQSITNFPKKPRTLVVDITLNALTDSEIKYCLKEAKLLIESGELNLVFIQSLTKFAQLGLDKLSAGFLAAYNNGPTWTPFNNALKVLENEEPVDSLTLEFFAQLAKYTPGYQKQYIDQINENTKSLYNVVLRKYQDLNLPISKKIIALSCNTDQKTCYLAFNSAGVFSHLDPDFKMPIDEVDRFTKDVIKGLFIPLSEWLDLPLTERMSIGFPLSSINDCMHVIRFTVGLEKELLPKYADLITYICFVLNREIEPKFLFESEKDQSGKASYPRREEYFREKIGIFKAMYPVENKNPPSFEIREPVEAFKDGVRTFVLRGGTIKVLYDTRQRASDGSFKGFRQTMKEDWLSVHFGPRENISLTDPRMTPFAKCLLASCLTNRSGGSSSAGAISNPHTVTISSTPVNHKGLKVVTSLQFDAFFYIRGDNSIWSRFGYYNCRDRHGAFRQVSFDFKKGKIWLVVDGQLYNESRIFAKKGDEFTRFESLDTEEKWNLFDRGSYERIREYPFDMRYKPDSSDPANIELREHNGSPYVIIERDLLITKQDGFSLYYRKLSKDSLQLEIDVWGVKNPIQAKFLRLFFWYNVFYRERVPFDFICKSYGKVAIHQKDFKGETLTKRAQEMWKHHEKILSLFEASTASKEDVPCLSNKGDSISKSREGCHVPFPKRMEVIFSQIQF